MIEKGLKECKGIVCECWKIIEEYILVWLEYFEMVKGFYFCDYYMDKYYFDFEANFMDCDVVCIVYSCLKFVECFIDDECMK